MDEALTLDLPVQQTWDAGFEGGRYIVFSRLGPFSRVFERPPTFKRQFWHRVYPLAIRDWTVSLTPLHLGQLCVVEAELLIRYQPTLRYVREHLEFLDDLNAHLESSLHALLQDLAEQELKRMQTESAWLADGCDALASAIADLINEVLLLRGIRCRSQCRINPRFAAIDSVDLDALPPWLQQQAIYEDFLRRRRAAKERILNEQTEEVAAARQLLMAREAKLLELARAEEAQRLIRRQHELAILQAELNAEETRLHQQRLSESRRHEADASHQAELLHLQAVQAVQAKQAELQQQREQLAVEAVQFAERIDHDKRLREQELQQQAELRQRQAEAELHAMQADLEKLRAQLAAQTAQQTEQQTHELHQREQDLLHQNWLRQMQIEADILAKQAELDSLRLAEETRRQKEREAEARQREAQLRHENHLQQLQTSAELQRKQRELEQLRADLNRIEDQLRQQREYEARQQEEQLRHDAQLRQTQTALELAEQARRAPEIAELEGFLNREIGLLATERQRLRLEDEIRELKLARTRDIVSRTRRRIGLGSGEDDSSPAP